MFLRRTRITLVAVSLCLLSAASAADVRTTRQQVLNEADQLLAQVSRAATADEKLGLLSSFKAALEKRKDEFGEPRTDEENRYQLTVRRFASALAHLDEKDFTPGDCEYVEAAIVLGFNPKAEAPKDIPVEPRKVLEILALLCQPAK